MPNIVTAVLASYRGFDTLGEVVVVFAAGVAVILLLGVGSVRGGRSVADKNGTPALATGSVRPAATPPPAPGAQEAGAAGEEEGRG